jgi:hypothetical protein
LLVSLFLLYFIDAFFTLVEGKAVPVHAMKAYRGSSGIAPLVLNLGTRYRVVNLTLWPLYIWERTPVPIE